MDNDIKDDVEVNEEESFADLFAKSYRQEERLKPGQKLEARVIKISNDWVFLDTGRKGEGVIDRKEFLDVDGNLTVAEGDTVSAYFLATKDGEFRFTTKIGGGAAGNAQLEDAWQNAIPVEGVVEKEIKGGYEVKLAGNTRAFCPFSQMGLKRVTDPAEYVGKRFSFKITTYGEKGRNIVVSRRELLEAEQRQQKDALKETLQVGMRLKGTVTSIRDFGAFVDIGGMEGLIPISEVAWGRVKSVSEVLSVGQEVEVVLKQADWDKDRISFSLKDTLADPWDAAVARYPEGSTHTGRVSRLAAFGAFVTLEEGIDGLLHIGKLGGGKRINHPREVLKEGETVEVIVEGVDRETKRISLALAAVKLAEAEQEGIIADFRRTSEATAAQSMGSLGDLLQKKLQQTKK